MEFREDSTHSSALDRFWTWWFGQPITIRLYQLGFWLILLSIVLTSSTRTRAIAYDAPLFLGCILWGAAFLREAYVWMVPKLSWPLVKITVGAIGVTAAAAATGVSRSAVSEATGQDAAHFGTTIALLAPLSFIPVLVTILSLMGIVALPLAMLWALTKAGQSGMSFLVKLARVGGAAGIVLGAGSLMSSTNSLAPVMNWVAGYSAYGFDMRKDIGCAPTEGDRVVRINDDLVIVGRITEAGPRFVRNECPLVAEAMELPPPEARKAMRTRTAQ